MDSVEVQDMTANVHKLPATSLSNTEVATYLFFMLPHRFSRFSLLVRSARPSQASSQRRTTPSLSTSATRTPLPLHACMYYTRLLTCRQHANAGPWRDQGAPPELCRRRAPPPSRREQALPLWMRLRNRYPYDVMTSALIICDVIGLG